MADENKTDSTGDGPDLSAIAEAVADHAEAEVQLDKVAEAVGTPGKAKEKFSALPKQTAKPRPNKAKSKAPRPAPQNSTQLETKDIEMENDTINTAAEATDTATDKMQAFYARANGLATEMAELGRGNLEAAVEAGRIWTAGLQDIGRTTVEETRTAYEGMTGDVKRMAAVKSPTELMQVHSDLARRNMDAFITQASKNTETMLKLANDVFAPVSNRMSVAMDKLSRAA